MSKKSMKFWLLASGALNVSAIVTIALLMGQNHGANKSGTNVPSFIYHNVSSGHPCYDFSGINTYFIHADPHSVYDCLKSENNSDGYWLDRMLKLTGLSQSEFIQSFAPADRPWIQEAVTPRVRM